MSRKAVDDSRKPCGARFSAPPTLSCFHLRMPGRAQLPRAAWAGGGQQGSARLAPRRLDSRVSASRTHA
eukprot:4346762-Pleurochrysis_carterae.AAC.1